MSSTGLTGKKFIGKIVKGLDPNQRGMYYVHCPELLPHIAESTGIICTNSIHPFRLTNSDVGMYGSYFPLHPGTVVQFECLTDDASSARIIAIVSDDQPKSDLDIGYVSGVIPTNENDETDGERKTYEYNQSCKEVSEDRDEQYIILMTPSRNAIYINEKSNKDPDAIFVIYHAKQTAIRINPDGIHISTDNNEKQRISGTRSIVINQDSSIMVTGGNYDLYVNGDINIHTTGKTNILADNDINIKTKNIINIESQNDANIRVHGDAKIEADGNTNVHAHGNMNLKSGGELKINSSGDMHLKSDGAVNIDGVKISLNGGQAKPVSSGDATANTALSATPSKKPVAKI